MRRVAAFAVSAALATIGISGICPTPPAVASTPCPMAEINGANYRIAEVMVSCDFATEVVERFYLRYAGGEQGPILHVFGFRCSARLAATQLVCQAGGEWIGASSRPEDHPAHWNPPPPVLGAAEAARFMRKGLNESPRVGFEAGYARRVRCNNRISRSQRRCRISWVVGDAYIYGKGAVWLTEHGEAWNFSYRLVLLDEYCVLVEHRPRSRCSHILTRRPHSA